MTIKNRELFVLDPAETEIPNLGVAKVKRPEDDGDWKTLEWELKSFVCEGEYRRGMDRILGTFLSHLSQAEQPAVWVSGFYGSGKSHLVRVLEHLWRDEVLPSGQSTRDLVSLPDEITAHLKELTIQGKRNGGLWSAAGTLGAGRSDAVRLAFLSVLFESADLPQQYPHAKFILWADDKGYLPAVEAALEAAGKTLDQGVVDLYVSPIIGSALLDADPLLGSSPGDVLTKLSKQFPPASKDVSDDELFATMEQVLARQSTTPGKLPLTLIVLDEMQQYLNEEQPKALAVQNIVEGCSSRFGSQVVVVATGQSALTATPTVQRLTDRFTTQVALSDADVEAVIRKVILRKKPDQVGALEARLGEVSGEIARHLAGTKIGPVASDGADLVPDYPLLPTRRRFWERTLRAIDTAGKAGVLRTQLKIVHEANQEVAEEAIGRIVGADFLYDQQSPGMLSSGVLLKDIDELVRSLRDGTPDGDLKSRICALVFLISQLSRSGLGDTGVRATPPSIADLLVEDLGEDGARLRKRVPELLDELVEAGRLQRIDEEFFLQTEEGVEWTKDFSKRRAAIREDAARMTQVRNDGFLRAIDAELAVVKLVHGESKTPRKLDISWGEDAPKVGADIPVWIRDGWTVSEKSVREAAAAAGDTDPVVHVLLPRHDADALRDAAAEYAAAKDTVDQRPSPQTEEGKAAQRAMRTRSETAEGRLRELVAEVLKRAQVFQGGGHELTMTTLREAVQTAAERSLVRLFPRFKDADKARWPDVVKKASAGAPDALTEVGHAGDALGHPVCKEVFAAVSAAGSKGLDLQKRFAEPHYGWPKDAVDGALLVLVAGGHLVAHQDGIPLKSVKELPRTHIGKSMFYKDDDPPTMQERLAVRKLLAQAEIPYESGQEGAEIPALLQKLVDLASSAGGAPPLPETPSTSHVLEVRSLGGNEQFRRVAAELDQFLDDLKRWSLAAREGADRTAAWTQLERLLDHGVSIEELDTVRDQAAVVRSERRLLDQPDPVAPLIDEAGKRLRAALKAKAEALQADTAAALGRLRTSDGYVAIGATKGDALIATAHLAPVELPAVSTTAELLHALDAAPLARWQERAQLVVAQESRARELIAKELEPTSVTVVPPHATLRTEVEVLAYVEQLKTTLLGHVSADETVII